MTPPRLPRIHAPFDAWLETAPTRPFLFLDGGRRVDFAALGAQAAALETELHALGVGRGDRVLVVAENAPEHVALVLACSRVGAWSCGVNARMAPAEIATIAARADARCVYFTTAVSAAAAAHAGRANARPSVLPGLQRSEPRAGARAETGDRAERVAAIIFTSGTTGLPKGAMVTHEGLLHFGRVSAESRRLGVDDRSYACLPMTHVFGLATVLMASLHAGAGLVLRSQFDPVDVADALAHHGVSQLQGPPTFFSRLLDDLDARGIDRPAAPALRYLYTGAAPLERALKQRVEARFGHPLHHGYGLSEYAGSVHVTALGQHRDDTSAGLRVEGAELRIVGADDRDLAPGAHGEIWLRGRGLMAGYFRDDAATAAVMKPGGWYASGDIGFVDADGALFVVGRLKEMIIRSGFNVYPAEVEAALQAFDAVQAAAVVGRAERDGNEAVVAFVTLRPGRSLDRAALAEHLRERLAPYKRPAAVEVVDALPMTTSGKVLKRALRARLDAGAPRAEGRADLPDGPNARRA